MRVTDPDLTRDLEAAKGNFSGYVDNRFLPTLLSWVLPALIFIGIWSFALKRMGGHGMGGMMEIGKSKAKVYMEKETGVTFDDVAGIDEAEGNSRRSSPFSRTPSATAASAARFPRAC